MSEDDNSLFFLLCSLRSLEEKSSGTYFLGDEKDGKICYKVEVEVEVNRDVLVWLARLREGDGEGEASRREEVGLGGGSLRRTGRNGP